MTTVSTHKFTFLRKTLEFDPQIVAPGRAAYAAPVMNSLALDIAGCCNMRCIYCAESATLPPRPTMTTEMIDRSLDVLSAYAPRSAGVSVHLGSGEPLLEPFSVCYTAYKAKLLAKSQGRPLELHLTTNGTLLDDAMMSVLVANRWNVKVSIDGPACIHDSQRRDAVGGGTYDRVERVVKALAARLSGRFSTTSVLCRGTDPMDVFKHLMSLGVAKIELVPVVMFSPSQLTLETEDTEAYRHFISEYAKAIVNGDSPPTLIKFRKRLKKALGFTNSSVSCGAGRGFFASSPDGQLYPCFRFIGLEKYRVGDVESGLDMALINNFINGPGKAYQRRDCSECWAAPLCGGPCFACTELFYKGKISSDYCSMVQAEGEAALWVIDTLRESDPARLLRLAGIPLRFT